MAAQAFGFAQSKQTNATVRRRNHAAAAAGESGRQYGPDSGAQVRSRNALVEREDRSQRWKERKKERKKSNSRAARIHTSSRWQTEVGVMGKGRTCGG